MDLYTLGVLCAPGLVRDSRQLKHERTSWTFILLDLWPCAGIEPDLYTLEPKVADLYTFDLCRFEVGTPGFASVGWRGEVFGAPVKTKDTLEND